MYTTGSSNQPQCPLVPDVYEKYPPMNLGQKFMLQTLEIQLKLSVLHRLPLQDIRLAHYASHASTSVSPI
jgi:hypothetical protein